jgi:hypothetical protein
MRLAQVRQRLPVERVRLLRHSPRDPLPIE